jgi:hypothetical protein
MRPVSHGLVALQGNYIGEDLSGHRWMVKWKRMRSDVLPGAGKEGANVWEHETSADGNQ